MKALQLGILEECDSLVGHDHSVMRSPESNWKRCNFCAAQLRRRVVTDGEVNVLTENCGTPDQWKHLNSKTEASCSTTKSSCTPTSLMVTSPSCEIIATGNRSPEPSATCHSASSYSRQPASRASPPAISIVPSQWGLSDSTGSTVAVHSYDGNCRGHTFSINGS
jgi:hypothetical protein